MFEWIDNLKNRIDFVLRNRFKISREGFSIENESKDNLFEDCENKQIAESKEAEYFDKYKLEYLKNHSSKRNYLENLYIIELLEKSVFIDQKDKIEILDIGSKNWFYANGEHAFFKYNQSEKEIFLTGIELDAYRVYSSFYSRYDAAKYYINNLDNTKYIAGNFLNHKEKYDYITWFFPFITKFPLLKWGLPMNFYKPQDMLLHAYDSLKEGAQMLIVNQGEEEYKVQKELYEELNINFVKMGLFESCFLNPEYERYYSVVVKNN